MALQWLTIAVMDNLSSHKRAAARAMIAASGAELRFLPPCSPDFDPIEMAFAKLEALLRKAAERTVDGLWSTAPPRSFCHRLTTLGEI